MKVVLRSDVEGVGHKGDVVDVADGYARNYLVPKNLALKATPGAERQAEAMRRSRELTDAKERSTAEEMATRVTGTVIRIAANAGEGGRLFGSVTAADVVTAVAEQVKVTLDRRTLVMPDQHIKELGTHEVRARPHPDVDFPIMVEVVATTP
jgi:large subunit ribosomal protein L9